MTSGWAHCVVWTSRGVARLHARLFALLVVHNGQTRAQLRPAPAHAWGGSGVARLLACPSGLELFIPGSGGASASHPTYTPQPSQPVS